MDEKDTESPEQVGTTSEEQFYLKEPTAYVGTVVEAGFRFESNDQDEQTRKNDSEQFCPFLSESMENLQMASVEDSIATSAQLKRRIEKKFMDPTLNNPTEERECLGHFQEDILGDGGLFQWSLGELASETTRVRHLVFSCENWNQEWRVRFEWFRQSGILTAVRLFFRLDTEPESPTYFYFDLGLYNSKGEMLKHWSSGVSLTRKSQEHRCQSISYDGENLPSVDFDAGQLLIEGTIRRGWNSTWRISEELAF